LGDSDHRFGGQVEAYLAWRRGVARERIDSHWGHVESLAAALLERRRLTFAEIKEIIYGKPVEDRQASTDETTTTLALTSASTKQEALLHRRND